MTASVPAPIVAAPPAHGTRLLAGAVTIYIALTLLAHLGNNARFDELAAFVLAGLFLLSPLRQYRGWAWSLWLAIGALLIALDLSGHGRLALDATPIAINLALFSLFARTLGHGREPLIARVVEALEGRSRLAEPGVATYAHALTRVWACLFLCQAIVLAILVILSVPDGLLAVLGISSPIAISHPGWRWYLHFGSYAVVPVLLILEYGFRRWHLRHLPHPSLPQFLASLLRRWHALVYSVADDRPRSHP